MSTAEQLERLDLPARVQQALTDFVSAAAKALGSNLRSVVLYGSAADGKLRATSDVNVVVVLLAFEQGQMDQVRDPLRVAQAAIQLRAMFVLQSEIEAAARAFAQKFADILRRHRVLYGDNPLAGLTIAREAKLVQLRQQLLNLTLRLRSYYVSRSLREEQAVLATADAAGPLRSCAAALLELEGQPVPSPKQALERVTSSFGETGWETVLANISKARETRSLPAGTAAPILFRLVELAQRMHGRAEKLY
ncbi:MAG: nucleotidyltransferase domain-containing protein [Candidatus Acidiferrales bacterium]